MAAPHSTHRPYTPQEDAFIRSNWRAMPIAEMARQLGRHKESVASRAGLLGLSAVGDGVEAGNAATIAAARCFEEKLVSVYTRHGLGLFPVNRAPAGQGARA
jgi:hypothetical protein